MTDIIEGFRGIHCKVFSLHSIYHSSTHHSSRRYFYFIHDVDSVPESAVSFMAHSKSSSFSHSINLTSFHHVLLITHEPLFLIEDYKIRRRLAVRHEATQRLWHERHAYSEGVQCHSTCQGPVLFAWWGFVDSGDKERLEAFISKAYKAKFCSKDVPSFGLLCEVADESLFRKGIAEPGGDCETSPSNHVLRRLLPPKKPERATELRPCARMHNYEPPCKKKFLRINSKIFWHECCILVRL